MTQWACSHIECPLCTQRAWKRRRRYAFLGWTQRAPREGETPDILEIHKNCRRFLMQNFAKFNDKINFLKVKNENNIMSFRSLPSALPIRYKSHFWAAYHTPETSHEQCGNCLEVQPPSSRLQILVFEWKSVLNFNTCAKFQTRRHLKHLPVLLG